MRAPLAALLLIGLSACTEPPPDAYVTRSVSATAGEPAGTDARNEACQVQPGRTPPADRAVLRAREVFCGGWTQPAARVVELHTHVREGEVMRMRPVTDIPVPAGQTVELRPGGLHVMLIGLTGPLQQGSRVPLTLRFERAGEVQVELTVEAAGARGSGHGH